MLFITQEEELRVDSPVQALYFYAPWMPFHSKFMTMIGQVEEKHKDISFFAINVDQFASRCQRFSINSIPSVVILQGGRETARINGLALTDAFKCTFADICNH